MATYASSAPAITRIRRVWSSGDKAGLADAEIQPSLNYRNVRLRGYHRTEQTGCHALDSDAKYQCRECGIGDAMGGVDR
ncbi:hypothetical protein ACN26Z_12790 [Verrucosispora sp. WMMD703]|uniref:hypothetical protein n=1 Tax=Verrucosispora sp. WMMD703 TaxID=3403463 RepID=UPI003B92BFEC